MKTETITIEKEIFIAEDGTEFDAAEACEKHENREAGIAAGKASITRRL